MLFYDPRHSEPSSPLTHNPFPALIAPRPIAWVSSVDASGTPNLAPFSHFNIVSVQPPMVMFAPSNKDAAGTPKDTLRNLQAVPEFVISIVSWEQRLAMNATSAELPHGQNEFEAVGVTPAPSVSVRPPRVAASKAALECNVWRIIELPAGRDGRHAHVVIGEVIGIHIDSSVIVDGRVSAALLAQISRLGYFEYSVVRETFQMPRPEGARKRD